MKILVLHRNESTLFMDVYEQFKRELAIQVPSTVLYGEGYDSDPISHDISEIYSQVGDNFDIIYLMGLRDGTGKFSDNPWVGLNNVDSTKILLKTDIHNYWNIYQSYLIKNNFRSLICPYPKEYQEKEYGPNLGLPKNISIEFFPHSADIETYHPYDEPKIFDVSVLGIKYRSKPLGMIRDYAKYLFNRQWDMVMFPFYIKNTSRLSSMFLKDDYPLRSFADKHLRNQTNIKYFTKPHPGRYLGFDYSKEYADLEEAPYLIGNNFARALSASKIVVVGSSRWKLPLQKTFQTMACKSLVITQTPHGSDALHFEDGWNYVNATRKNVMDKIDYYLKHENEREEIAQNGYDTILKYHTMPHRVEQFITRMEELINQ